MPGVLFFNLLDRQAGASEAGKLGWIREAKRLAPFQNVQGRQSPKKGAKGEALLFGFPNLQDKITLIHTTHCGLIYIFYPKPY